MIKIKRETVFAFVIFMPYIERRALDTYLSIRTDDAYFRAMLFVLLFGIAAILVYTASKPKTGTGTKKVLFFYVCYFLYMFCVAILHLKLEPANISVMLWFFEPMIFAFCFVRMCIKIKLNIPVLFSRMIRYFAVYVLITIVYNVLFYGLFRKSGVRMTTPGGGCVIFAYTTAFVFALTLAYRECFPQKVFMVIALILTIGVVACGSRGGMWPILGMWFFYYGFSQLTKKRLVITMTAFITVLILNPISMLQTYFPHLFEKGNKARGTSSSNLMALFKESSIVEQLFGHGPGGFFHYQKWIMDVANNRRYDWDNYDYVKGYQVLVQPHNTYIYMLYEYGLIAVILLVLFLLSNMYACWKSDTNRNKWFMLLPIPVFAFVNCFDSILFVQPGTAAVLWTLLLLYLVDVNKRAGFRFFKKEHKKE